MGHAISRSKPSIVAFDLFAREPSIDVFCGGWGAAIIEAIPQAAKKQKRNQEGLYFVLRHLPEMAIYDGARLA